MVPWRKLIAPIQAETAGEGVFVRPAMRVVGLHGGWSRPPSRDEVITPDVYESYKECLAGFQAGGYAPESKLVEFSGSPRLSK